MQYDHERPRTALVAGGSGALGSAVTAILLEGGERVCVPWVVESEAERLRGEHGEAIRDGRLRLSQCDCSSLDQVAALLDVLRADWGPLWLACSLVGGWAGGTNVDEIHDMSLLDRMLTLNLRTAAVVAAEGLRHMGGAGGRIVLVGSRTALVPAAGQAAYSAAKGGVLSLVATLAEELRGTGRTANAVVPDIIDTPANRAAMPDADHSRWLPPRALGKVIAWLASADAWPVSGAAIPVSAH
ncbi:MAG: SDR family NAD(P)-dependent oxidoreductase [Nitriliruptorales bacterium]|nr:SDR family NAD(P)-dependent oxidoreductase [Nitriliruptorales bacterium]